MGWAEASFGVVKIVVWLLILFRWVSVRLFRPTTTNKRGRPSCAQGSFVQSAIKMMFVCFVFVHALSFLGILDTGSLIMSFVSLALGKAWYRDRPAVVAKLQWLRVRTNMLIYGVLDGKYSTRSMANAFARKGLSGLYRAWRIPANKPWHSAEFLVLSLSMGCALLTRLPGILGYPFPENGREFSHIFALKTLGANSIVEGGVYPLGTEAMLSILARLTLLDEVLLWKLMGIVCAVILPVLTYLSVRMLTAQRRDGSPLLAAVVSSAFIGSDLWGRGAPSTEFHPWYLASLVLLLCLVGQALGSKEQSKRAVVLRIAMATTLLGVLHPLAWLAVGAGSISIVLAKFAWSDDDAHPMQYLRSVGFGLSLGSVIPIASLVSLLAGSSQTAVSQLSWSEVVFNAGGETNFWDQFLSSALLTEKGSELMLSAAKSSLLEVSFFFVAGGASVVLLLAARASRAGARQYFAAAFLGIWTLASLRRLGVFQLFSKEGVEVLLVPLCAVLFGVFWSEVVKLVRQNTPVYFRAGRGRYSVTRSLSAGVIAATVTLALCFPPRFAKALAQPEPLDVLRAYGRIRNSFTGGTWTVVGHDSLSVHALGYGWHLTRKDFLAKYSVDSYEWDPRRPNKTVPSKHTFLFVEKPNMPFLRKSGQGDEERIKERVEENRRLHQWCRRFLSEHSQMSVYHEDNNLVVFHIMRTREEEREVLDRVWREEHSR